MFICSIRTIARTGVKGRGGGCKTRLETRAANDPSVFSITEKAITENAFMFVCNSSAITRSSLQDKAGGDTRPLPPGRDIRSIIHRFTFVLIVSVISQVDTDGTLAVGGQLCVTVR